jgi:hypothetical protein
LMQNTLNLAGGTLIAMLIVWVAGHMIGVL